MAIFEKCKLEPPNSRLKLQKNLQESPLRKLWEWKIEENPEYKQKLISEIYARCKARNHDKNGKTRHIPKNEIEGYYFLRGKNRQLAKDKGLSLSYNKVALLATSIFKLSHWRNDVTVASYMLA